MHTTRVRKTGAAAVMLYRLTYASRPVIFGVGVLMCAILLQPLDFAFASEETSTTTPEAPSELTTEAEAGEALEEPDPVEDTVADPAAEEEVSDEASEEESEEAKASSTSDEPEETETVAADATTTTEEVTETTDDTASTSSSTPTDTESGSDHDDATSSTTNTNVSSTTSPDTSSTTPTTRSTTTSTTTDESTVNDEATEGSGGSGGSAGEDTTATTSSDTVNATTSTSTNSSDGVTTSEPVTDDAAPETDTPASDDSPSVAGEGSDQQSADIDTSDTTQATSSSSTPPVVVVTETTHAGNRHQFSEAECVAVGDGAYYCSKDTTSQATSEDAVYAAPDTDGDQEIFVRIGGETTQLTENFTDDLAPEYDRAADSVVWHRLIDGRYQVMHYDLTTKEERQLTSGTENNMEPTIEGEHIFWQYWDGNDWEIMHFNGETTNALTDNEVPDISPSVNDGYVIWSTVGTMGQQAARVYSLEHGTTELIEGTEGGAVLNPRFVLVYDTKYDNGDVVTSGYDLEGGGVMHLASLPAEVPTDIPDADPTEETRALIQNKSSKEEEADTLEPVGGSATGTPTGGATASSTDTDMAPPALDLSTTSEETLELTEYDVVVPEFGSTSAQTDVSSSTDNLVE